MSQITLEVPEPLLEHLARRAAARNSTIERVVVEELQSAMQPASAESPNDGPFDLPAAVVDRISSLERPADWDGEGAEAITREACTAAVEFLKQRDTELPLPRIAPSCLGGVSLYWTRGDNRILVTVTSQVDKVRYEHA